MPRLVFLPPDLSDPVHRRNGDVPSTRVSEPGNSDAPTTRAYIGVGTLALALFGLVALGIYKLAELVTHAL